MGQLALHGMVCEATRHGHAWGDSSQHWLGLTPGCEVWEIASCTVHSYTLLHLLSLRIEAGCSLIRSLDMDAP